MSGVGLPSLGSLGRAALNPIKHARSDESFLNVLTPKVPDAAPPAEVPLRSEVEAPKRGSEQFATREQTMRQAAAAAGVTRGGNDADMLGGGSKSRSNAARKRLLGE